MSTLGSRIKSLRKRKKKTLSELAGTKLSKGMLSLIENDKAQPSMESLAYIAANLDVEVNELLETISITDVRDTLKEIINDFQRENYKKVIAFSENMINQKLPISYESAKLMELYGKSCYRLKKEFRGILNDSEQMYLILNLFNEAAKINIFVLKTKLVEKEYISALELLYQKKEYFRNRGAQLDIMHELDFTYYELVLLFALGKYKHALEKLQEAILLSKKNNIFYHIEDLYRIACYSAMLERKESDMNYYLKKLALLGDFLDSKEAHSSVLLISAHYHIEITEEFDIALKKLEKFYNLNKGEGKKYYVMEKGKALYGKKEYNKALEYLLKFGDIPEESHPLDLAIMYTVDAYISRCYYKIGKEKLAATHAYKALANIEKIPFTPYKQFIEETFTIINRV